MTHHCLRRQALRVPMSDTAQFLVPGRRYVTADTGQVQRGADPSGNGAAAPLRTAHAYAGGEGVGRVGRKTTA